MKKRSMFLSVVTALCMLISAFSFSAFAAEKEKPDVTGKTSAITQQEGAVAQTGWGGADTPAAAYAGGTLTMPSAQGQSAVYALANTIASDSAAKTTFTSFVFERGTDGGWYQWILRGDSAAASDFIALKWNGDVGAVGIWSRVGGNMVDIDTSLGGTAGYAAVFVNTDTYFGADFLKAAGDKVKIEILSEPTSLSVWMSYWDGNAFGEAGQVYADVTVPSLNALAAPFGFGDLTGCKYSEIAMYDIVSGNVPQELPDVSEKENLVTIAEGNVAETGGFDAQQRPARYENGLLTGQSGFNAKYTVASKLNDVASLEVMREGVKTAVDGADLSVYNEVVMWPDEGSTHTLTFAPRGNAASGANVLVRVGINKEGSAHGFNVFIEDRADGGAFNRKHMITDIRTVLGEGYSLSKITGEERVRLCTVTQGAKLWLWMSYSSDSGATYSEPTQVYNGVEIVRTTPHLAVYFMDGGNGVYSEFKTVLLEELPPVPEFAGVPDVTGKENLVTVADGDVAETGGFDAQQRPARYENGLLTGQSGFNAKYTIAGKLNDISAAEIVREGETVAIDGADLTVYNEVVMWPDEGSTHTLNFSPRGNSATMANVIVRVGINKEGSAHGFNVFIEDRADGGAFNRKHMITDIRTVLGEGYSLSKITGEERVKLCTVTRGDKLWLWMSYSSDGGASYSEPALVYDGVKIVKTTPHTAVFFLDSGNGVYGGFKTICLDELAPPYVPDEEPTYPDKDPKPPVNDEQLTPEHPAQGGCGSSIAAVSFLAGGAAVAVAGALIKKRKGKN